MQKETSLAEVSMSRMKAIRNSIIVIVLACLVATVAVQPVAAQGGGSGGGMGSGDIMGPAAVRGWFKSLNLTEEDLAAMEKLLESREIELVKAQNEIRILQMLVSNELLNPEPDMKRIEEAVTRSLEWEKKVRLIQIERQIGLRRILGEERWQSILLLVREARASEKAGRFAQSFSAKGFTQIEADRYGRLLRILRRIM